MNITENKQKVLVAPLDWGLGHATRCIPLIHELVLAGHEVSLAADGATARLLQQEFPQLPLHRLPGYGIHYNGNRLSSAILKQLPAIFRSIRNERNWLKELLKQEKIDVVISDNRPGLYNRKIRSIYITHQLLIKSGKGNWVDRLLQRVHTFFMKRFHEVWVPDLAGDKNLAGDLSHPKHLLLRPKYLGLLSRLHPMTGVEKKWELMVLLSGPEPQRTLLEEKILVQLQQFNGNVLLVRGLPGETKPINAGAHINVQSHLPASQLAEAIQQSDLIICRSGYTTLMDLVKLNAKALLIPTPGQPEQEYLAAYMQQQEYFPFVKQDELELLSAIAKAKDFVSTGKFEEKDFEQYQTRINSL